MGVVAKDSQAVRVQQGPVVVALLDLDDPGRIANHSMAVVVLVAAKAVATVRRAGRVGLPLERELGIREGRRRRATG